MRAMTVSPGWLRPPAAPNKWHTLIAVCLGLGMLMIDTFVVNVALPTMGRTLRAQPSAVEWTVSGYVLVVGVLPITMGRLGDIFGRRRVFLLGLVVFVIASALCGAATDIKQLIAFRVLQGAGAATMFPGTLSIITQVFPPQQRGLAIGIWGGVSGLGLIAGPLLGGLLVRGDSWRWIFYVNLPVGIAAILLSLRFVPESRDESAARSVDWRGLGLLSGALVLLMFGFNQANDAGWTSPPILACFAAGAVLLPLFVLVERRTRHPLIDLSLFRSGTFVAACISAFLFSAAVFGSQPYISMFMQNYWGFSALEGGLAFIPATALVAALMPLSGMLGQRLGGRLRLVIITGSLCVLVAALLLLGMDTGSGYVDGLLPSFIVRGLGIGLVMSSSSLAVMSAVPVAKSGLASGTFTMSRNIGTAMGVAVFGAVFARHIERTLPGELAAAGIPAAEAGRTLAAAERFVPLGGAEVQALAAQAIVDGFVRIAVVTLALAGVAALTAVFIRHRSPVRSPAPAPAAIAERV